MNNIRSSKGWLIALGIIAGIGMALLAHFGNPGNMALCTICFIRDMSGALGLHSAEIVQYFRPEIVGIVIGAFMLAWATGRLQLKSGSSPAIRFALGAMMGILGLVFLGCTLRMIIRMASGDLSAYIGFVGFFLGSWVGVLFLKKGFSLGEGHDIRPADSISFPLILLILFVLFLVFPDLFHFSSEGPGSMHAPVILSLVVGLLFGAIAQQTNLCMSGSVRSIIAAKDFTAIMPALGIFLTLLVYNLMTGQFQIQAYGPIAHAQVLWNILPMFGMGIASALAGGCPVRQLIKAASGNGDGFITTIGTVLGVAMAHNFGLASSAASPESVGGPAVAGKVAVIVCIIAIIAIACWGIGSEKQIKVGEVKDDSQALKEA